MSAGKKRVRKKGRELSIGKVCPELHKRAAKQAKVLAIGTCLAIEDLTNEIAVEVAKRNKGKPKRRK